MKRGLLYVCCCLALVLTACSLPRTGPPPDLGGQDKGGGRLLSIRIERWDTVRFSGLLGLRETAEGLYYVLLDATGVKLLEVEVAGDGSDTLLRLDGPLKKTDFAPFLSEALLRIYLQEPVGRPCSGSWVYQVCREDGEDNGWRKIGQVGPFKVWQVSASRVPSGADGETVIYRQPWLGVRIFLEPTKRSQ